jgi:hypothetical protein
MPNNSNARREKKQKEKKKQGKKKRTVPPPLHKEDTASVDKAGLDSVPHPLSLSGQDECIMDTSFSSLSLAGAEKEPPLMMGHAVMMEYYNSLSDEERTGIHEEALRANPRASAQELIEVKRTALWKVIHKARKMKDHAEKDTSSLSLAENDDVNQFYVRGPAQKALLDEFRLSITEEQRAEMYGNLSEEYPDANAKELAGNLRAVMVTAALEARRKKIQDKKDRSFPPSLSAGTVKPATPLSLKAQP